MKRVFGGLVQHVYLQGFEFLRSFEYQDDISVVFAILPRERTVLIACSLRTLGYRHGSNKQSNK